MAAEYAKLVGRGVGDDSAGGPVGPASGVSAGATAGNGEGRDVGHEENNNGSGVVGDANK